MAVHTCDNCDTPLEPYAIWKALMSSRGKSVECKCCGSTYDIKAKKRVLFVFSLVLPVLFGYFFKIYTPDLLSFILFLLLYLILMTIFLPLSFRYKLNWLWRKDRLHALFYIIEHVFAFTQQDYMIKTKGRNRNGDTL